MQSEGLLSQLAHADLRPFEESKSWSHRTFGRLLVQFEGWEDQEILKLAENALDRTKKLPNVPRKRDFGYEGEGRFSRCRALLAS